MSSGAFSPGYRVLTATWHQSSDSTRMNNPFVYRQIAELHATAIDQGFLSQLGPRFLTLLYEAIDQSPTSILIVEMEGEYVKGFVSGGTGLAPIFRHLLGRLPALVMALWPVALSPRELFRIAEILMYNFQTKEDTFPKVELYSIAVSPQFRGSGTAVRLYNSLREALAKRGLSEFKIIVGETLLPAQAFYTKMGAVPVGKVTLHGSATSTVFVDSLNCCRLS